MAMAMAIWMRPQGGGIFIVDERMWMSARMKSPAEAVEHLRIESARLMIEQSRHSIDVVAVESGFADPERRRRAFLRAFGQTPQAIRRIARVERTESTGSSAP